MASLAVEPNGRRRLVVELLARTGMRVGELCALEDDAMVRIAEMWLSTGSRGSVWGDPR